MGKLNYCHMCGLIFEDKDVSYGIGTRDTVTKKEKKLFDTCEKCAKSLLNIKFKPAKASPKVRKDPHFTSIILTKNTTRQEKLIYDVLPYQLDIIKDKEIPKDELELTYKSGTRIYTEFQVKKWLSLDLHNLIDGMMLIYAHQTEDEKKNRETKYANSVGFNKPDASVMTGMARIYETRGYDTYSKDQIAMIEKIMSKYSKQLTLFINADKKILEGV